MESKNQKRKENKAMTEFKTNNNTIVRKEGYNICPQCGRHAYAVLVGDGSYRVGCLSCGLRNGINVLADEAITDSFTEKMRIRWNEQCLEAVYSDEVMEELGVSNGNYVLTSNVDGHIVHIAQDIREAIKYIEDIEYRLSIGVYLMLENTLQYQGSSFGKSCNVK